MTGWSSWPNQFGLDHFDFADAYGEQKEHLCSQDLREFVEKYRLALDTGADFNPRLAFGSHSDADHIYNTPRAWFMARYFLPAPTSGRETTRTSPRRATTSPWSFVPEHKVTRGGCAVFAGFLLPGTPYNPYDKNAACKGKYPHHWACPTAMFAGLCRSAVICRRPFRVCSGCPWGAAALRRASGIRQRDGVPQILQRHNGNRLHGQHVLAQPAHCRADRRPLRERLVV